MKRRRKPNRAAGATSVDSKEKPTAQRKSEPPAPLAGKSSVLVVGVGASAGGLEAFTELLRHLPTETGFAFVLVQHLDPHHASALPRILSAKTRMEVREAAEGDVLKPNVVFVLPADKSITVSQGVLWLGPRGESTGLQHPIDVFLRSLATDQKSRAVAVILSGSGSDGALGVRAVKDEGGIVFSQDEGSAQHAGMPQSAIATGCVDFVLTPEGIARELARLGGHSYLLPQLESPPPAPSQEEAALRQIFILLRNMAKIDFSQYQQSTIRRRLERRMALAQVGKIADYLQYVLKHGGELERLLSDLHIRTTRFFRDGTTFEFLARRVFPSVMKNDRSSGEPLRLWVPACSTGEEAYSLLIRLLEWIELSKNPVEVQMFASDVSESAILQARRGNYPENISADVSAERLGRFFSRIGARYEIKPSLRKMCVFAKHDLVNAPPFSRLDLVSCRNLLIYLGREARSRVLSTLHYSLKPGGILVLGGSEGVGEASHLFHQIDKRCKVYSKQPSAERSRLQATTQKHVAAESRRGNQRTTEADPEGEADRITLARYTPPGVLINEDMTILQFRGDTSRYIRPASGKASLNLVTMLREGLQLGLRSAVLKAKKQKSPVRKTGLRLVQNGRTRNLSVEVVPISGGSSGARHFLIAFLEDAEGRVPKPASARAGRGKTGGESAQIAGLKRELAETKTYLKSVLEDQSTSVEELQAANEELESSNEELQSTNEELETSKEEIDATNEELNTLNTELTERNVELTRLHDYVEAVFNTVRQPLLLLDPALRVKQANRAFYDLFRVSEEETVGRPVGAASTGRWDPADLLRLQTVLSGKADFDMFVTDADFPEVGRRNLDISARCVRLPVEDEPTLLLAIEDISTHIRVRKQQQLIEQLSNPVLPLQNHIVLLPIIGMLDLERLRQLKEKLPQAIRQHRAKIAILDITGARLEPESKDVERGFMEILQEAKLLGATVILTGISGETAQDLVNFGVDPSKVSSVGDLQSGFDEASARLGYQRILTSELDALREELRKAKHELDAQREEEPTTSALPTQRKLVQGPAKPFRRSTG